VKLRPLTREQVMPLTCLKASKREAALLDLPWLLRSDTTLLITDGPRGCRILRNEEEERVPAFPAVERDPTGAGDCFLAGVAVGLSRGLELRRAVRVGAYCGARAVEHIGVPRFTPEDVRAALKAS
jgi:1D-myo-inositol 3-kinase